MAARTGVDTGGGSSKGLNPSLAAEIRYWAWVNWFMGAGLGGQSLFFLLSYQNR
jgi:hypothetical protein